MPVKFHEKNQAVFVGLQTAENAGVGAQNGTLVIAGAATSGVAGQFSCTTSVLYIGQEVVITGTNGGTGVITGYITGNTYYIIATNNTTTFTLSATRGGVALTTTVGTLTGLTFTANNLGSTSALAVTAVTADPTRETGSFQFLGDALSRDEYTYEKDKYIDLSLETFQQVLGQLTTVIDPNVASIWKVLQTCGANIAVDGTTKFVTAGNNLESPDYATVDVRLSSPDDPLYDKLYKFTDLRGTVDVDASIGEVPKLKFSLKGNVTNPQLAAKQSADFGFQTTRVASSVLPTTIQTAQVALIDDVFTNTVTTSTIVYTVDGKVTVTATAHGITLNTIVALQVSGGSLAAANGTFIARVIDANTLAYFVKGLSTSGSITGATIKKGDTAAQTFCFSTLSAPNFFGFDLTRFQTGCATGFAKGAVPTDLTVGLLEDQVGAISFNPDIYVGKFFGVYLQFGTTAGNKVGYMWDKAQVANVKQGKVGAYLGRDVTMRNTGQSYMLWN